MNKHTPIIIVIAFILTTACVFLSPKPAPTVVTAPPIAPAAPDTPVPAPTNAPEPTATLVPTNVPEPTVTPTLIILPQQWSGTYTQAGIGPLGITVIIEKMDGDSFTGKMIWAGTSKFRGATTKVSGQYVKDFGDAMEQAKWGNHPDYKKGDRSGTWIKWTEDGFVKGSGFTLGGWYYGHIQDAKTMIGIYYLNDEITSFASSDSWELTKK